MDFPQKLAYLRKKKRLTQQVLARMAGVHVIQLSRYEKGSSQPTLDVLRKLSRALNVTADELIFDKAERGPDADLRLQFEAVSDFSPKEKLVVKSVLEALILRHQARKWADPADK